MGRAGRAAWALLALILCVPPAHAQQAGGGNGGQIATLGGDPGSGRRGRGQGGRNRTPSTPALPDLPRLQEVWPRLDAGAVLCGSRDELVARARLLAEAAPGAAGLPQGCRLVRGSTGVTVVERVPPGATEVKLRDNGELGWTDAYLPDRPPGG